MTISDYKGSLEWNFEDARTERDAKSTTENGWRLGLSLLWATRRFLPFMTISTAAHFLTLMVFTLSGYVTLWYKSAAYLNGIVTKSFYPRRRWVIRLARRAFDSASRSSRTWLHLSSLSIRQSAVIKVTVTKSRWLPFHFVCQHV